MTAGVAARPARLRATTPSGTATKKRKNVSVATTQSTRMPARIRRIRKRAMPTPQPSSLVLARGDDPPEPPAVLARGDDPPEPPAVLARGDDPPEPPTTPAMVRTPARRSP